MPNFHILHIIKAGQDSLKSPKLIGKERMQEEIWFQKYRIIRLLGRGGTARVYLAEHVKLNSYRAIKCLSKNHPLYELQLKEAYILKNLKHPCIPIIYDIEEDQNGSYIVEQYLEGVTLKSYVAARGYLASECIMHFALQLCDLIHYLHHIERPLLYLDLKPDNIIVAGNDLKLVDFGSALYRDEAVGGNQGYCATYGYAAPELYQREGIDERCDVYGIGMLMYFMATGCCLGKDNQSIGNIDTYHTCSRKLKKIISRCLRIQPQRRYASAAALSKAISAGRRSLPGLCESGPSIRIAVAGVQPRIGVTHLCFRLCKFFMQKTVSCIYRECNASDTIRVIRNRYEGLETDGNTVRLRGITMLIPGRKDERDVRECQVLVEDYGILTKDKLASYLEADLPLLLLGGKDWELNQAEEGLRLLTDQKKPVYLFNFMDGNQFRQAVRQMGRRNCLRIPYAPDPYANPVRGAELEFLEELAETVMERICQ